MKMQYKELHNMECSICRDDIMDKFGHNAEPINSGRCCDICNSTFVIPFRIQQMFNSECD